MTGLASDLRVSTFRALESESPGPHAAIQLAHHTETNPCHQSAGKDPEPSLATPAPTRSIIYVGMDVHKDAITIACFWS